MRSADRRWLLAGTVTLALGCGGAPTDRRDDQAGDRPSQPGGKADTGGIEEDSPEALGVLRVANESGLEVLDDSSGVGLDRRAAQNIVAYRLGDDGEAGNDDDERFDTLAELDAIPYVGPGAFEKLLAYARAKGWVEAPAENALRIATFNIRWYGLGGTPYMPFGSETRNETIRTFVHGQLLDRDVIVLQEIVDLPLFVAEVMPEHWACVGYEGIGGRHQRVVLCHTDRFRFDRQPDDDNYAFEPLRDGRLRPGLQGRLYDLGRERHVAHVMAVHLKAKPWETERRLRQVRLMADRLAEIVSRGDDLPVIAIGDFNTHRVADTGLEVDDWVLMDQLFDETPGLDLTHVDNPFDNTYRTKEDVAWKLDNVWVSDGVGISGQTMLGACNLDWETGEDEIARYYDEISDHCPFTVNLTL